MRIKMMFVAVLCFAAQGAVAETLEQLSGNSAFVRNDLRYLKQKNAVSVYAGTKPYCPSVYWSTSRNAHNRSAKEEYRKDVSRQMKQAGFSAQVINHCVDNSGFVFENGQLRSHPKNTSYLRYVETGIMVYRKRGSAAIGIMPILIETHTYGKKHWRVFDASLKETCTFTKLEPVIKFNCNLLGAFNGHWKYSKGHNTATGSNSTYEVILVTRRTPSFAKSMFRKTFGG